MHYPPVQAFALWSRHLSAVPDGKIGFSQRQSGWIVCGFAKSRLWSLPSTKVRSRSTFSYFILFCSDWNTLLNGIFWSCGGVHAYFQSQLLFFECGAENQCRCYLCLFLHFSSFRGSCYFAPPSFRYAPFCIKALKTKNSKSQAASLNELARVIDKYVRGHNNAVYDTTPAQNLFCCHHIWYFPNFTSFFDYFTYHDLTFFFAYLFVHWFNREWKWLAPKTTMLWWKCSNPRTRASKTAFSPCAVKYTSNTRRTARKCTSFSARWVE